MAEDKQYTPEIDYKERNYVPLKSAPNDVCTSCKAYYKNLFDIGKTETPFPPRCKGHITEPLTEIEPEWFDSQEEYEDAIILHDPVSWANYEFEWEPRWYQDWVLGCTADLKLLRCGRRLGKCLVKGTKVPTPSGIKNIEDLIPGDEVYDENGKTVKVKQVFDQGRQEVYDIYLNKEVAVSCTVDHPFLMKKRNGEDEVLPVKDLKQGYRIKRQDLTLPLGSVSEKYAYFYGAYIGVGHFKKGGVCFKITEDQKPIIDKCSTILGKKPIEYADLGIYTFPKAIAEKIPMFGELLEGKFRHEKYIPIDIIKSWDRASLLEFVAGLVDSSGGVHNVSRNIDISIVVYHDMVKQALEYAFESLWQAKLPMYTKASTAAYPPIYLRNREMYYCIRAIKEMDQLVQLEDNRYKPEYDSIVSLKSDPSCVTATLSKLSRFEQCYDIHVESDTNLYTLANGLITHNTESLIIETLNYVFTHKECNILMCAPREKQVTRFFDEMAKFIRKGRTINQSISRHVKSPARMEFKNNSKVMGFTLNPNQGDGGSVNVRGQDADLIIVDELDFIADKDLDVLFAIKASHPHCRIIGATTPSGRRGKFYKMCVDKNVGWKEFWFISQESPNFTADTEKFFRDTFNETEYTHEVHAEFGEPSEGVFKKKHIDKSIQDYDMESIYPDINGAYILGVDWNKSHGTHMVIVRHVNGKLVLTKKIIIPESEYMQSEAVQHIINLHNTWNFKYIFVDAGYGSTQVELLKKHGLKHPQTRLYDKVKPITMNQSLTVKDPHTGDDVKKFTKPYIVQSTAKLMEDDKLILPSSEDTAIVESTKLKGLVQQIRNYRVLSYSVYGQPQYSKEDDHTITAYMLACAGYVHETGDLAQVNFATGIIGIEISGPTDKLPSINELWTEEDYRKYMEAEAARNSAAVPSRDLDRKAISPRSTRKIVGMPEQDRNKNINISNIKNKPFKRRNI